MIGAGHSLELVKVDGRSFNNTLQAKTIRIGQTEAHILATSSFVLMLAVLWIHLLTKPPNLILVSSQAHLFPCFFMRKIN